jgi:photosystem II stability/assembly factor-like uncharacterized protein
LIFSNSNLFAKDYWIPQNSPVTSRLIKCSFPDSLNGWAAGENGDIIHTSNGGINWFVQNSPVNFFIESIFFLNSRLGWGVANDYSSSGSSILSTTNGGINWSVYRYPDSTYIFKVICFVDSLNGWMGGYHSVILNTTNGGLDWKLKNTDSAIFSYIPVLNFSFYNSRLAFACGGYFDISGIIWRTTNYGNLWNINSLTAEPIFAIVIFDSLNIVATGGDWEFGVFTVKTSNGGINWVFNSLNTFGIGQSISFRTRSEGWIALSAVNEFAFSIDSGRTWSFLPTPDTATINDLKFVDPYHGWAVGSHGIILKYNTDVIGINKGIINTVVNYRLFQNYPNPFNPTTDIKYNIPKSGLVKLIVYDVTGKEVATLINSVKPAGSYSLSFDASNMPSGVYFYKLTSGSFVETKKMALVK